MAEAVILSAIESLDRWLLTKPCTWEESFEKLYSLIVGMEEFGEEKQEMLHSLLFGMADFWENNSWLQVEERERNKENLLSLLDLREDTEKMYSVVVEMADFWEDNTEKLYWLLFIVGDPWRDKEAGMNEADFYNFLDEIADLWGDDEGEVNKEMLHSLLDQMLNCKHYTAETDDSWLDGLFDSEHYATEKYTEEMCRISGEMEGLWKDKHPKLNQEKLYSWVANKAGLREAKYLLGVLLTAALLQLNRTDIIISTRERVEEAKNDLGLILDFIAAKKLGEESCSLRYFISDAADMARHAHLLVHLKDSHPFSLFLQSLLHHNIGFSTSHANWLRDNFAPIMEGIKEIMICMLESGIHENVGESQGSENVVGLEKHLKVLLYNENVSSATIIWGMPGIGKTTLAKQLYNHTTITQQFKCRAWVHLSRMFSRKEILLSLIRQVVDSKELVSPEEMERADYRSLIQVLRQHLERTRYFIVLDDVWKDATHLKYVMEAFPQENGSRLLLTTRSVDLHIKHLNIYGHKMESMDGDESWTLLLQTLFIEGTNEEFPKPLVKKARQILNKCNGLPLAIKEVGRKWVKKRQSGSEWEEIVESIDLSETLVTLESSYRNLDPELKMCFLHLSFFKEGATIRAKKLVHILVVEGLVSEFEEINPYCLHSLWKESIIEVKDLGYDNYKIKTCRIHAIFHKLSITKAEDELNFEILGKDGNNRPSHDPRHRAIYCSREKLMINYSSNQDKHLVSLFFYGGGYFSASPSYWKNFEQLKTLDMEDFGLTMLPDAVGMLIELRYLGLRNNYIQELPCSLGNLKKLEVLDVALNFMMEVADIIWEMDSLRHLFMCDISFHKPLKIDALKNLRTLTYISADSWTYEVSRLKMMTSLNRLGIEEVDGNSDVRTLLASLSQLENLYCLILRGFRFRSMPSLDELGILENVRDLKLDGLITRLPSANNFPPYIYSLILVNSCLDEDPMPTLEKLFYLNYLKLQNAYTGQQMVITRNGFPRLQSLAILELWHLTNVQVEKGAIGALEYLEINSCPHLQTLSENIFPSYGRKFKMNTSRRIAKKIRESSFISRILEVDIQP